MRKTLLLFAVGLLLSVAAAAQVTWNVKGGVGIAANITDANVNTKSKVVAKLGIGLEKPLTPDLSLMPSLEFATKGGKYGLKSIDAEEELTLYYLQLPVLLAYRFNAADYLNITAKAGPYFAYALSGKLRHGYHYAGNYYESKIDIFDKNLSGITKAAKRFDVGLDAGVDFELRRFVLGLEYEVGLMSMAPNHKRLTELTMNKINKMNGASTSHKPTHL